VIKAVDAWLARHAPAIERTADVPVRSTSAAANTATSEERALETSPVTLALREAISLYAAHEEHRGDVLQRLLAAPDPRLRAWGTRFVGLWADHLPDPLALVSRMIADPHPRVRLEAVVAASYIPQPQAIEIAVRALDQPRDRFIDYALRQCARALLPQWQPALASGQLTFGGNAGHLAFIVQADAGKESIGHVRQLLERARLDRNVREGLLVALVNAGEADDLAFALEKGSSLPVVLDELATVAHVRNQRPSGDLTAGVQSLLDARNNTLRTAGLRLAAAWKTAALAPQVQAIAVREGEDTAVRAAAVESLAALMGANAVAELATFAASSETTVARAAIRALAPLDVAAAAGHAAKALAAARTDDDAAALLQSFLARQGGTDVLGKALAATPPSADGAKLALQALGTLGRDEPALREVLYRAAGLLVTAPPEYSAELVARLIADARTKGNAYNGSALFRSAVTACVACHKIGSEGGETGPDLSAIGRGMTPELIVESVLWPRRQIKEGYFLTQVTTGNGGQHQGYIQSENATELVLRDPATGVDTRLRKPTIKERHDTGTLMPEGLTAALTGEQVRDLLRYLLELGK
jgi:putative heme-binding domain-containing protein